MARRYTLQQARTALGMTARRARRGIRRAAKAKPSAVDLASLGVGAFKTWERGLVNPDDPKGTAGTLRDSYTGNVSGWRYAWEMQWRPFLLMQGGQALAMRTKFGRRIANWKIPLLNLKLLR